MKYLRHVLAATAVLSLPIVSAIADSRDRSSEPAVMGYVENVYVGKLGLEMKGKLDTGADSSSVFARDVNQFDNNCSIYLYDLCTTRTDAGLWYYNCTRNFLGMVFISLITSGNDFNKEMESKFSCIQTTKYH